ncbi:hypothetical protein [Arthrobacter sp. NPDC058192]|uniref:hypothetical protein n=1 Tax=Arthrobacter sp. NPDC058192 TaxID=3346372 RepID=UPI0036E7205E
MKRNRFVKPGAATKSVNRELEAKARDLAGIKGYVTNLTDLPKEEVIAAYHRLFEAEKSFRMSKSDPVGQTDLPHTRHSIEAHLTIVFAALAVSRWLEAASGWSISGLVKTTKLSQVRCTREDAFVTSLR